MLLYFFGFMEFDFVVLILLLLNFVIGIVRVIVILIVIYWRGVDVNFCFWRSDIVIEIYEMVLKNKFKVLKELDLIIIL